MWKWKIFHVCFAGSLTLSEIICKHQVDIGEYTPQGPWGSVNDHLLSSSRRTPTGDRLLHPQYFGPYAYFWCHFQDKEEGRLLSPVITPHRGLPKEGGLPPCGVYWQHIHMWIGVISVNFVLTQQCLSCLSLIWTGDVTGKNMRTCSWTIIIIPILCFSVQINHTRFMVKRIHIFRHKFRCWQKCDSRVYLSSSYGPVTWRDISLLDLGEE